MFPEESGPMPAIKQMTITMPTDLAETLRQSVADGKYASDSEIVREALGDWTRRRNAERQDLKALNKKGLLTSIAGFLLSIPIAYIIYLISRLVVGSDPILVVIITMGMIVPFIAILAIFHWRHKKIKQYKNFDPNSKLPQCTAASTSAIISGLGIGNSLTSGVDINLLFSFLSILLLGSFTILSIADNYGDFQDNPKNDKYIREFNNKIQSERMKLFSVDLLACLLLPFFAAIIIARIS